MLSEISERRRVKPPSESYQPEDLLPYTVRGITRKYALLLGQCIPHAGRRQFLYLCALRIH
jgi:hypothetical protein